MIKYSIEYKSGKLEVFEERFTAKNLTEAYVMAEAYVSNLQKHSRDIAKAAVWKTYER